MGHPGPAGRRHHRPGPVPPAGARTGRALGPARRRADPGLESLTPEERRAPPGPSQHPAPARAAGRLARHRPRAGPARRRGGAAARGGLLAAGRAGVLAGLTLAGLAVAAALTAW